MRYFLELSYFGKAYHGWQKQPNAVTVQEVVERSIQTLLKSPCEIVGAGRTDAGVHARQIFAHFDVEKELAPDFLFRLNALLPKDIAAREIRRVHPEAHARFDAVARSYEYHIVTTREVFELETAYHVRRRLDFEAMQQGAEILKQYKNYKSFSKSRTDVRTFNCDIRKAHFEYCAPKLIFHVTADRFLRNMVRAIVGTMIEIGQGKLKVADMHDIIRSEDRGKAGFSVPAHGLFLTAVEYPQNIFI